MYLPGLLTEYKTEGSNFYREAVESADFWEICALDF